MLGLFYTSAYKYDVNPFTGITHPAKEVERGEQVLLKRLYLMVNRDRGEPQEGRRHTVASQRPQGMSFK